MSIAFNGRFLSAPFGGVQRVAHQLIRAFDAGLAHGMFALDGDAEIICPGNAAPIPDLESIKEHRAGMFTGPLWEQFDLPRLASGRLLLNICNLAPISMASQITMIHDAQVYLTPQSYSRAFSEWYRFALPLIGRKSIKILTVSNFSRDMLSRYGVASHDKIEVIYNGVNHMDSVIPDTSVFVRFEIERPFVVCIASAQSHKNLSVVCEAFRQPDIAGIKLVLVGECSGAALSAAGIRPPENTLMTGRLTDGELRGLLEAAVAYACPSLTEGFGLPPLEAMSVGCPAVVAPCGALPEVCGDAALYADPHDPNSWSQAFRILNDHAHIQARASAEGRARAALFTWERSAKQLHDILAAVA